MTKLGITHSRGWAWNSKTNLGPRGSWADTAEMLPVWAAWVLEPRRPEATTGGQCLGPIEEGHKLAASLFPHFAFTLYVAAASYRCVI